MSNQTCCVCTKPASRALGPRPYCDEHFEHATRDNKGLLRSSLIDLGSIIVFTVVVYGLANVLPRELIASNLLLIGIVLAVAPAVLWLGFFYRQDRLEPEPRHYVFGVFVIALLATDFIWRRVVIDFFHFYNWVALQDSSALIGNILVVGFILEAIVYAVVRATVYPTAEFDERMDGIVYGTAAGLGVATMLNLNFILESGGAELGAGVIHVVVTALAQAAFGGVVGYFMGEMKFIDEPFWWMPLGVILASVLNGVFNYLLVEVNQAGMQVSLWRGLLFALLVAVVTFGALLLLIRRAIHQTLHPQPAQTGD